MNMDHIWGDSRPWNSYSRYFKSIFGERVQKVAINAGFTCPNRDGLKARGGCTFCVNEAFNPSYCDRSKSVDKQISEGIEFHKLRYAKTSKYLAYFQAYTNTYKPLKELKEIYSQALNNDEVLGVIIGTRPDCVDEEKLDYFAEISKTKYVALEYGIESCYNETLERVNRQDTYENAVRAVTLTAERGLHVGGHFILGLPGESREMLIEQTSMINALPLETVKFHQLQIFKGSLMEKEYLDNPNNFNFFTVDEYIKLFSEILVRLRPNLIVERFAGEAPPRFVVAPEPWGIRNEGFINKFEKHLLANDLYQGKEYKGF